MIQNHYIESFGIVNGWGEGGLLFKKKGTFNPLEGNKRGPVSLVEMGFFVSKLFSLYVNIESLSLSTFTLLTYK